MTRPYRGREDDPDKGAGGARLRYGSAVLSGALLAAAFPPPGLRWLCWIALVPWFSVLLRDRGAGHRGPSCAFGLAYFTMGSWWLSDLSLPFPFLLAAFLSLYPLLFAVLVRLASPLGAPKTAALLPFLWVGTDLLRQHLFTGFPWLFPGHALAASPTLRQAADLGGAHLLTFEVVLAGAAGGLLGAHLLRPKRKIGVPAPARWGMICASVVLPLCLSLYGDSRRLSLRDRPGPRVLLVQPCFPQTMKKEARESLPKAEEMLSRQRFLSIEGVMMHPGTDLVVWAETMIPGDLRAQARLGGGADAETRVLLLEIADPVGVVPSGKRRFLGGAIVRNADKGKRNAVLLVGPRGAIEARCDKTHLTPFGEYLPLLGLLPERGRQAVREWVKSFSPFLPDLVPGEAGPMAVEVPGPGRVNLGCLVCYEVAFPGIARERVRQGADVLVNLSNYAWYGAGMREQALDFARLRAVETRRPVVLAANDGPTAILDGNGEVRKSLEPGVRGVLFGEVPLDGRGSVHLAAGDLFAFAAALLGLVGAGRGWLSGRRRSREAAGNPSGTLKNC